MSGDSDHLLVRMGASSLPPPLTAPKESMQTENKSEDICGASPATHFVPERTDAESGSPTDSSSRHGSELLLSHGEVGSSWHSLWSWNGGDQRLPCIVLNLPLNNDHHRLVFK